MCLTRLALENFRNYASVALKLDGRHVCLYGANGSGKTNLIEAVSMLSPGRGLRGADLTDIIRADPGEPPARSWALSADLRDNDVDRKLHLALETRRPGPLQAHRQTRRRPGHPGRTRRTRARHLAHARRWTASSPAPPATAADSSTARCSPTSPRHGPAGAAYEKAMRQRNALLEQGRADPAWLDALEQRMAEAGAVMATHRADALKRMQAAIQARAEGMFPKAVIDARRALRTARRWKAPTSPKSSRKWPPPSSCRRTRDQVAGRTLEGVHRTDLKVHHATKGLPADQCSTGEQKALLTGLIFANAQALFERDFAPSPLLLLDEAAAHLDSDRRAALYDELAALGGQAWLTGTDRSLFDAFGDRAQRFEVSDGVVRED